MMLPLLAAVALAASVATSQPSTRSGDQQKTSKSQIQAASYNRGSEERPVFVESVEIKEAAAERARIASEAKEKATNDVALTDATRDLERDTFWLAGFTLAVVFVAGVQLWMFKRQLDQMREDSRQRERPRMRFRHLRFKEWLREDHAMTLMIELVNYGTAPAAVVEVDAVLHAVDSKAHLPPMPFINSEARAVRQVLPIGVSWEVSFPRSALTATEFSDIITGARKLYCFAYVDYTDDPRRKNWCGRLVDGPIRRRMKSSCCRAYRLSPRIYTDPDTHGLVHKGAFVNAGENEQEHEYED